MFGGIHFPEKTELGEYAFSIGFIHAYSSPKEAIAYIKRREYYYKDNMKYKIIIGYIPIFARYAKEVYDNEHEICARLMIFPKEKGSYIEYKE